VALWKISPSNQKFKRFVEKEVEGAPWISQLTPPPLKKLISHYAIYAIYVNEWNYD